MIIDSKTPLTLKGVVYNEMKGVYVISNFHFFFFFFFSLESCIWDFGFFDFEFFGKWSRINNFNKNSQTQIIFIILNSCNHSILDLPTNTVMEGIQYQSLI